MPNDDTIVRTQLTALLKKAQAHADIESALADFPLELASERPHGFPYSAWQLLEHMRIALRDLLEFSTNPEYIEPKWPDDYWPKTDERPSAQAWQASVRAVGADLDAFIQLIEHGNLYDTIPWGKHNENLLREVLLAADHNSYHVGQLIVLRKLLGTWKKD